MIAIYAIKSKVSGKIYIGSTINLDQRWGHHRRLLKYNKHHSIHLQRAVNRDGLNSFDFIVIEELFNTEKMIEREQYWMDFYKSHNPSFGFNIYPFAKSAAGFKRGPMSECVKEKIRRSKIGKKHTEEQNRKQSLAQLGKKRKPFTIETRRKMSKPKSDEAKYNMHIAALNRRAS